MENPIICIRRYCHLWIDKREGSPLEGCLSMNEEGICECPEIKKEVSSSPNPPETKKRGS